MLEVSKEQEVEELNFNTKFIYELDEKGINTAKKGLENLLISAPYVLAFVPEVNSIALHSDNYNRKICREDRIPSKLECASVTKVSISKTNKDGDTDTETKYIFALSNDSVSIAVETTANDREIHILKPSNKLPRIFCDFPLLGTEGFAFPVIINSSSFNPTEPRDGIPLIGTERSEENKNIISNVVGLFNTMLNHFVANGYKNLYHVVKVPEQVVKKWLDDKWIEDNLLSPVKEHIKTINLINNSLGALSCLYDDWGNPNIFIMKDETPELRKKVWELSNRLMPAMMTPKDEIEHWYNSLWVECRNFGIIDLIKEVEKCGDLTTLNNRLGCDSIKWLNDLISLLYHNSSKFIAELGRNPSILPTQHGDFLPLDKIYAENNIGETYKDLALIAGIDFRKRLLDNRVSREYLQGLQELNLKNVFYELIHAQIDKETKIEFYKFIINLRAGINERQSEFVEIAKRLYPDCFNQYSRVSYFNEKLLSDALKFWREKTCIDLSLCTSINGVLEQYDFQYEREVADWVSKLANHFRICDDNNLLDKYAILPNQCGVLMRKSEIFLDDGSVNEILKDAAMYSENDVRQKMLFRGITLDLPPNRIISLEYVAPAITAFVRNNYKFISKQNFEMRETFRNTSTWIRNNRKVFKELIENIHWFYDDEEIAESMAKSEQYDEVLKKYNVADINDLANILASHSVVNAAESETISISKELLAQWGITSEEDLRKALSKNVFGSAQIHQSTNSAELFDYVKTILNSCKK
ncbi:MAG: ATP-binding protein [Lachnospiraceae bacterium]|nr:ATP-binding protein [Lachnospiraceae bacterium]